MKHVFEILRDFFSRDPALPLAEPLLHGAINSAAQELYYAELMDRENMSKYREYPWTSGWNG